MDYERSSGYTYTGTNYSNPNVMRDRINSLNLSSAEDNPLMDYKYLFFVLMKKWWIIAITAIVSGIIATIYSFLFTTPIFSSDTTLFLYRRTDQITSLTNELTAGEQLVKDSLILIKSASVADKAIERLTTSLKPTTNELRNKITVSSGLNTRIITIQLEDPSPGNAAAYADAVAAAFVDEFNAIINVGGYEKVDFIHIIDKANISARAIKPNKTLNILLSIIVGLLLGIGIVFVVEKLDDTFKTPDRVKTVTGLEVLGVIMMFDEVNR